MENTNEKTVSLLNGLIEINNDRIDGYEKAAKEVEDPELKSLFIELADDSRQYRGELITEVVSHGGSPAEGNTAAGKVYHAWMDIKAALTAKDTKAIVSSCEFGEDAAVEAYDDALESNDISAKAKSTVSHQRTSIKESHDKIKMIRDAVKAEK
ncbi:MAG TPA: PA2169 family four-helix-bundle protein [Bacteroidia bacterium]|nr:PA2169 family four-helix-bundle protein [Bacteroidia bacterium]